MTNGPDGSSGILAKVNGKVSEYRVFFYLATLIILAFGFKYITPEQRLSAQEVRIELSENRIEVLENMQLDIRGDIRALTRLQCFNAQYKDSELRLSGIDCEGLR